MNYVEKIVVSFAQRGEGLPDASIMLDYVIS